MDQLQIKTTRPNLEHVLAYQNLEVLSRFTEKFSLSEEEVLEIFTETKKWLYLSARRKYLDRKTPLVIDSSILIIDEMWHNFILHTKDYFNFCKKYFGHYIHHTPTSKAEKARYKSNPQKKLAELKVQMENQYSYIYDELGSDTLIKWYQEYADKYTRSRIKALLR